MTMFHNTFNNLLPVKIKKIKVFIFDLIELSFKSDNGKQDGALVGVHYQNEWTKWRTLASGHYP